MSFDPNKPIDEQPSWIWRAAPWLFVGAAIIIGAIVVVMS